MGKKERTSRLIAILEQKNGSSLKELAKILNVTEMTIRRDVKELSESGTVDLVRGVAIYRPRLENGEECPYSVKRAQGTKNKEKEQIGIAAAGMIEEDDVIFLDIGTSAAWVARYIPQNMKITVMCFSANTLNEVLQKNVDQIIMSGGFYRCDSQVFECPESIRMMSEHRATKAFIVPSGASRDLGLTCNTHYAVNIKKIGLEKAMKKILLMESSKFDKVKSCCFGDWELVDMVITDTGIPEEWIEFFHEKGIELKIV